MINFFQRVLELCELERGHTLAVLCAGDSFRDYPGAFVVAATDSGTAGKRISRPSGPRTALGWTGGPTMATYAHRYARIAIRSTFRRCRS